MIPKQLQEPAFRFVKIYANKKRPIGLDWQTTQNYAYDNTELVEHIKQGGNVGVVCGYGGLLVVDVDNPKYLQQIQEANKDTFWVKSRRGGLHVYYIIHNIQRGATYKKQGKKVGEMRFRGMQVLVPPSTINKQQYTVWQDKPIKTISYSELCSRFKDFEFKSLKGEESIGKLDTLDIPAHTLNFEELLTKDKELKKLYETTVPEGQRSEQEQKLCNKLVYYGFTPSEINTIMNKCNIGRWQESGSDYRQRTLQTAIQYNKDFKPEKSGQLSTIKEQPKETTELRILTLSELMKFKTNKDFIIEKLIQPGTINLMYSPPGEFKTIFSELMALTITSKRKFLGYQTKKTSVLIADKENHIDTIKNRISMLKKGLRIRKKNLPVYFLIKEGDIDSEEFITKLSKSIKKNKIGFLILDTLVRFHSLDENNSTAMASIYENLCKLQENTGVAILLLHHSNKGRDKEYRGSGDILAQVDCAFKISRYKKTGKFVFTNTKNRNGEIEDFYGDLIFDENKIMLYKLEKNPEEPEDKQDKFKLTRAFILDHFKTLCKKSDDTVKRADLIIELQAWNANHEETDQISSRTIDSVLKHLVKIRILSKSTSPGYYCLNHAENEKINKWIEPLNEKNTKEGAKNE